MTRRKSKAGAVAFLAILLLAAAVAVYHFNKENLPALGTLTIVVTGIALAALLQPLFSRDRRIVEPVDGTRRSPRTASSARPPPFALRKQVADARWIAPAETVVIGATTVAGGLFYLGGRLALGEGTTAQYVINPSLPATGRPDVDGQTIPYWPSYVDITPAARRAFLDWMGSDRKDTRYGIGHVFVFFYGLEHRFFVDADQTDAAAIYGEVDRLLRIYGANHSFGGYATTFLTMAAVSRGATLEVPKLSAERSVGHGVDLAVQLHLGERLSTNGSLSADEALMWLLAEPETMLRTPAVRCFEEFVALWRVRFAKRHPSGLAPKLANNISLAYRAASGAFTVAVPGVHETYPDITAAPRSLPGLRKLAQDCTEELEAFSRLVGRKPLARRSMASVALLPPELQVASSSEVVASFNREIELLLGSRGSANPTASTLFELAGIELSADGKVTAAAADELGKALDRVDIAIEPDRRFGTGVPRAEEQVILFRAPGGGPVDAERAPYKLMRLMVEVAILAAGADGTASEDEVDRTIARIRSSTELSRMEQARQIAYAALTFKSPPKQARVMSRLKELPQPERHAIADAAVGVVSGDTISANDVKFLERLYKVLGLPREQVHISLHRNATRPDEPISISPEERVPGVPIRKGKPAPTMPAGVKIDAATLARRRRETEAASALLANIFADEPSPEVATRAGPAGGGSAIAGLDISHAELVELLGLRGSMARAEFDQHAREKKLLPEGAIERINEWSFDVFDEPLIEDGDELVVVQHLRQRIVELRENA